MFGSLSDSLHDSFSLITLNNQNQQKPTLENLRFTLLDQIHTEIDSTSDQKDIPWLYFISSTSFVMSITALLFRRREEPMIMIIAKP
ncbi:hypothetical protein YC2023_005256 [Brassica napus]